MRKILVPFFLALISLFTLLDNSSFASAPDLNYSNYTVLPAVDPSVVIRQQQIEINCKQLSDQSNLRIHLNLFEDISIEALLEKHSSISDGSFVWQGKIIGYPSSSVLFVINGTRVSGEITFSGSLFQVRSFDDGIYIVQEVNQTAGTRLESQVVVNGVTDDVITLTNRERAKYGLYALVNDSRLTQSAQGHADDMAQNDYFDHTGLDGRSPDQRITAAGYIWNYAAENIAAGYTTAVAAVNGWINSSGHHANMISSTACDIGVGYAYNAAAKWNHYWVQNFGRLKGVSRCPNSFVGKAPDVVTGEATLVGSSYAQLNGTVNPNGLVTTYYFEIGYSATYGSTSPKLAAGSGTSLLSVQFTPSGFLPLTQYHYRLVAFNSEGITYGQDETFTTTDYTLPMGTYLLLLN